MPAAQNTRPERALIVIRLSRITDESTSPERQRNECQRLCDERGYDVVGVAEDLDVSAGATEPKDRPALKPWLDNPHEYDVIVFYRVDRLVRRVAHLNKMIEWSDKHSINLVSATESYFDLSTSFGKAMANMVAVFAEMELDAISERTTNASRHNLRAGKWRGSLPPLGYMPDKVEDICWPCQQDGKGKPCAHVGDWRYVHDPVMAPIVREIVDRLLKGDSLRSIVLDLNERGVLSPRDRFREIQGKELKGHEWRIEPIRRSLSSPVIMGQIVARDPETDKNGNVIYKDTKQGKKKAYGSEYIVKDDDGKPIVRAAPIIDRQTFDRVQVALAERVKPPKRRVRPSPLLTQVVFCGVCGRAMYRQRGRYYDYYRCSSAQYRETCGNLSWAEHEADDSVTSLLMALIGDGKHKRREWDPGEDYAAELAEIDAELADLTSLIGTAAYRKGTKQRETLDKRISALAARQDELNGIPFRPSGYVFVETGQTFREYWANLDESGKNQYLREMSVSVSIDNRDKANPEIRFDFGELSRMIEQVNAEGTSGEAVADTLASLAESDVSGVVVRDGSVYHGETGELLASMGK